MPAVSAVAPLHWLRIVTFASTPFARASASAASAAVAFCAAAARSFSLACARQRMSYAQLRRIMLPRAHMTHEESIPESVGPVGVSPSMPSHKC